MTMAPPRAMPRLARRLLLSVTVAAGIVAIGCGSTPAPVPTVANTTTASPTAVASPAPSPTPRPPIPTPPPSPSPVRSVPGPAPVASPMPASPVAAQGTVTRRSGTLNLVSRENIAHQDVHQEVSPALSTWGPGIAYSRLLRFRSDPQIELPSLAVECDLCESWIMESDGSFVFHLRPDVLWHDIEPVGARVLTSDDIVYSYERQRQQGWPNAPLLQVIQRLEALKPDTIRISLAAPDADFLVSIADGHTKIVAREAVEASGDLKNGPTIGTGPWIFTATENDLSHDFAGNPHYFEAGLPLVEKLKVHIIKDAATRNAAFRVALIDIQQMEPQQWEAYRDEQPGAPSLVTREPGTGMEVALKASNPPFNDGRVRRAALLSMDPWKAIEDIWQGFAFVSAGFPVREAGWLLRDAELERFFDRPQVARDLLLATGVELPIALSIMVGDFRQAYLDHAGLMADEMEAVGFEPTVEVVSRRRFGDDVWLGGSYQMFAGPIAPISSPNSYLLPVLHSQGMWNTTEHQDEVLDGLIVAQAQELDAELRTELAREIQLRMFEEAYRFMPATRMSIWTWWPRVQGFHPNFAGFGYDHWSRVSVGE